MISFHRGVIQALRVAKLRNLRTKLLAHVEMTREVKGLSYSGTERGEHHIGKEPSGDLEP